MLSSKIVKNSRATTNDCSTKIAMVQKPNSARLNRQRTVSDKGISIQPHFVAVAMSTICCVYSLYIRKWREKELETLELAEDCGIFYCNNIDDGNPRDHFDCLGSSQRNIDVLAQTVERTGLMVNKKPGSKSVKVSTNSTSP